MSQRWASDERYASLCEAVEARVGVDCADVSVNTHVTTFSYANGRRYKLSYEPPFRENMVYVAWTDAFGDHWMSTDMLRFGLSQSDHDDDDASGLVLILKHHADFLSGVITADDFLTALFEAVESRSYAKASAPLERLRRRESERNAEFGFSATGGREALGAFAEAFESGDWSRACALAKQVQAIAEQSSHLLPASVIERFRYVERQISGDE